MRGQIDLPPSTPRAKQPTRKGAPGEIKKKLGGKKKKEVQDHGRRLTRNNFRFAVAVQRLAWRRRGGMLGWPAVVVVAVAAKPVARGGAVHFFSRALGPLDEKQQRQRRLPRVPGMPEICVAGRLA